MGIFSNVIFLSLRTGPIIVRVYFFTKSITRNETARFGIRVKCLFSEFQFELSGKVALPILLVPYGPYDMGLYWLNLHFQLPKKAMNHSGWKWNSAGKQKAEIHVSKKGNSAASAEFYFQLSTVASEDLSWTVNWPIRNNLMIEYEMWSSFKSMIFNLSLILGQM